MAFIAGVLAATASQADVDCPGARSVLKNLYFGDLHVHTAYSMDGYSRETRATPADAYAFARGQPIGLPPLGPEGEATRSQQLQPGRELDFAAVTDHSEYLGEVALCTNPSLIPYSYNSSACVSFRQDGVFSQFKDAFPARLSEVCGSSGQKCSYGESVNWRDTINAANNSTEACRFTAFVGYEWTGSRSGGNIHRNVIFRNAIVPARPFSAFASDRPQQLWDALDTDCAPGSGCEALTIPHNTNLSRGLSLQIEYPALATIEEQRALAIQRDRLERLLEVTQHKGTSECHPFFSNDELCDFELLKPGGNICGPGNNGPCAAELDTLRGALKLGLEEFARLGVNPLKLGAIASTDTHNGNAGEVREVGYAGQHGNEDATPFQRLDKNPRVSPGGLIAAWAVQNTRDAIFDAMRRRETYATSGPRIGVRFFAGEEFGQADCGFANPALLGYRKGVPMGGELSGQTSGQIAFLVEVLPDEVPIDRVQVIKGYIDDAGVLQEKILEAASLRHSLTEHQEHSCQAAGVDCSSLCGVMEDTDFSVSQPAFYYLRVLEYATPRWSSLDCQFDASTAALPACQIGALAVPQAIQERAWTSPIWYQPTP